MKKIKTKKKNKTKVNALFYGSIQCLFYEGLLYAIREVLEPAGT